MTGKKYNIMKLYVIILDMAGRLGRSSSRVSQWRSEPWHSELVPYEVPADVTHQLVIGRSALMP